MQEESMLEPQQEQLEDSVEQSLGLPDESMDAVKDHDQSVEGKVKDDLPAYAKERLGRQEKRHQRELRDHQRELRELRGQLAQLQSHLGNNKPVQNDSSDMNLGSDAPQGVQDHIQQAVAYALQHKERQELQAKEAEKAQRLHEKYQALQEQLDNGHDKYDDFADVVLSPNAPFTSSMRDAALLLPHSNADEVLYKLGKNKDELKRISLLHPIDQAQEMMKLSVALANSKGQSAKASNPIGQIKHSPVSPNNVNDKTSVSDLRQRMKNGGWR